MRAQGRAPARSPRRGSRPRRLFTLLLALAILIALAWFVRTPALRAAGWYLVVADAPRPADAIVVLGGGAPGRAMGAAELYTAGWAPRIVLVPGADAEAQRSFRTIGVEARTEWERSRDVLVRLGVPASAIQVLPGEASDTIAELRIAAAGLHGAAGSVILVTSPAHARRAHLVWQHASPIPAIVWSARDGDRFDPDRWWEDRAARSMVVREYLGIANLLLTAITRG